MSKCIAIIPARGGSKRIKKKNIRMFHGSPIISYSIETAKQSGLFDEIIVSTDSKEIADASRKYGSTFHRRLDEMSQNEIGTQAVIKNVLEELGIKDGIVCCIYPTAPLMSVVDLEYGFNVLINDDFTYAFSVGTNPLCDAGQFYWGHVEDFLVDMPLIDTNTAMIPIADDRVCDINTIDDFHRAEKMFEALHNV